MNFIATPSALRAELDWRYGTGAGVPGGHRARPAREIARAVRARMRLGHRGSADAGTPQVR